MDAGLVVSISHTTSIIYWNFYYEFNHFYLLLLFGSDVDFGILFIISRLFCHSISADEFLYQNQWGEIALLSIGNLSERILMSNTTYVSMK